MTIEDFITQRLVEDEATARAAIAHDEAEWHADGSPGNKGVQAGGELEDPWEDGNLQWMGGHTVVYAEGYPSDEQAEHIARHDPARVLEDQSPALRLILGCHGDSGHGTCWGCSDDLTPVPMPCDELRALASIWRRHPNYRPEWAVDGGGSNP